MEEVEKKVIVRIEAYKIQLNLNEEQKISKRFCSIFSSSLQRMNLHKHIYYYLYKTKTKISLFQIDSISASFFFHSFFFSILNVLLYFATNNKYDLIRPKTAFCENPLFVSILFSILKLLIRKKKPQYRKKNKNYYEAYK